MESYLGKIDFAYAFMMVHEATDREQLFYDFYDALKANGSLLVAEPYIHVSHADFHRTIDCARKVGFSAESAKKKINLCRSVVLTKEELG